MICFDALHCAVARVFYILKRPKYRPKPKARMLLLKFTHYVCLYNVFLSWDVDKHIIWI